MSTEEGSSEPKQTEASRWFDTLVWKHDYDGFGQLVAPQGVPDAVTMRIYGTDGALKDSSARPSHEYFPALLGSFLSWYLPEGEVIEFEYLGELFRRAGSDW